MSASKLYYGVFEWQNTTRRYQLAAVVGSRVYLRQSTADAKAEELNQTDRRYVVRSSDYYIDTFGCELLAGNRVRLTVPCPCSDSNGNDATCQHHHPELRPDSDHAKLTRIADAAIRSYGDR